MPHRRPRSELARVAALALPAVANSLLQTLVFLVDRIVLGHYSRPALAAMQIAGPVSWCIVSAASAFTVGTLAVTGRAVGARDPIAATAAARASLALALAIGLACGTVSRLALAPLLSAFGAVPGSPVSLAAHDYLAVLLPALPLVFVAMAAITVLQAAGDTRTPLAIGVVTNVLNIALNQVLVFGRAGFPTLGASGSAWSTVISSAVECGLACAVLLSASSPVSLRRVDRVSARAGFSRVLAVSWPAFGERVVYQSGYLLFAGAVVALGEAVSAANQAVLSTESISFLTADGCAVAGGALVAQSLGANDPALARRLGWFSAALGAALLAINGAVFAAVPALLVRVFRDDDAIVALGVPTLRVAALAQVPMAITVVLGQCVRAAGRTREAFVVSIVGGTIVRLGGVYLFARVLHLGLPGVWLASAADWVVRAVVLVWLWTRVTVPAGSAARS